MAGEQHDEVRDEIGQRMDAVRDKPLGLEKTPTVTGVTDG
jgi:hypothetical protein